MADIDLTKLDRATKDKYQITDNTFFAVPQTNPKDKIEVEIGDSKTLTKFLPQQKISRWCNEVNVSIRLKHDEKTPEVVAEDGKIKWKSKDIETHFYDLNDTDHPEGASEFEVILNKQPKSNVVEFTLVDKDVDYFYQPALTPEEIAQGSQRPENVEGSYAIYAKTPKTNWSDGKEYKCGKVGHIYRPRIIDSVGIEVWGSLHIENGILSVTIPQVFLDNAVYPVRHAAGLTFGYTTAGATNQNSTSSSSYYAGLLIAAPSSGNITQLTMYSGAINAGGAKYHMAFLYNTATSPTNGRLATGDYGIIADAAGWYSLNLSYSMTNAIDYWLSIRFLGISGYSYGLRYDAGSAGQGFLGGNGGETNVSYPNEPHPDTIETGSFSTSFASQSRQYSIYATYAAGGGATPSTARTIRLFKGFNIRIRSGKLIIRPQ